MDRARPETLRNRTADEGSLSDVRRPAETRVVRGTALLLFVVVATATSPTAAPRTEPSPEVTAANHRSWGSVSIVDGLPSDTVNAIGQSTDGAIWFATDRGLALQDGRGTRPVGLGDGEPTRVSSLAPLADGRMLCATDRGLLVAEGSTVDAYGMNEAKPFVAVATDAAGRGAHVAATADGDLHATTTSGSTSEIVDIARGADTRPDVASIAARNGDFFVAGRLSGLHRIRDGSVGPSVRGVPASVSALSVDATDGTLWIGSETGPRTGAVYRLDASDRLATVSTEIGAVTGLAVGEAGTCWVATATSGAFLVSAKGIERHETFASTIGGLRSDNLRCAFTDREGVVWFGGDRGASRLDRRGPETRSVGSDANGDVVRSIKRTGGYLWVGTNRGIVAGGSFATLAPVAGLDGKTVFAVEFASDGRLLAATQQGVYAASFHRNSATSFSPVDPGGTSGDLRARAIAVSDGATYIGTFGAGLLRLDGEILRTVDFVGVGDALRDVVCLYASSNDGLLIGTAGRGAYRMDNAGLTPVTSDMLAGQTVYGIAGSDATTLWFATDAGLVVRDGPLEARLLSDCDVRGVAPIGNRAALCATANRGAVLVRWDDRFGWLESRIDEERGLPSDTTFAVFVAPNNDELSTDALIGTSRGLTTYRTSSAPPVVDIAGALANRQLTPAEVASGIVLAYPQRSVVLELFATSTRTFRGQFQYGYTVTESNGAPVTHGLVRDGKVSLDRLTPGQYRIDVVAFDNDLVASDARSVFVTVERAPFPWTIAGLAAGLLIALLVLVWGARQNRRVARTNEALRLANTDLADARAQVARETERERSRIARDLHDQTLADLRRLMLLADAMPVTPEQDAPRPAELRAQIEDVSGEIRRICEDLSPSALSNLGLGQALEWLVTQAQSELPDERRFAATVTFPDRLEDRIGPNPDLPIQIYRIVQEAISNVSRHAKATRVDVRASVDDDGSLTVEVADDGVGFDPAGDPAEAGRGLGNMRWRADMIGASISWSPGASGGTVMTLRRDARLHVED